MKESMLILLILCLSVLNLQADVGKCWFHIGAITPDPLTNFPNTTGLIGSALNFGITEVDLIGISQVVPQTKTSGILKDLIHYLNQFDSDSTVLIVDGLTALFVAGRDDIC